MASDSDDDLEDGPVLRIVRHSLSDSDDEDTDQTSLTANCKARFDYIRDGLGDRIDHNATVKELTRVFQPPYMEITFRERHSRYDLLFRIDPAEGWATVRTNFYSPFDLVDIVYNKVFTERDACLGYIIQMHDIYTKRHALSTKMYDLHHRLGFPELQCTIVRGETFPFVEINMASAGGLNRARRVSVHFINERGAWPEGMWARVDVSTRADPSQTTTAYLPTERDAFNHIVSSMDTGAPMDYYEMS